MSHINIIRGVDIINLSLTKKKLTIPLLYVIFILLTPSLHADIINEESGEISEEEDQISKISADENLKIIFIWGGFSVNALVKNIGPVTLTNIPWEISIWAFHEGCADVERGTINRLEKDEIAKISLEIKSRYLGSFSILYEVGDLRRAAGCWWIFSFIFIGRGRLGP